MDRKLDGFSIPNSNGLVGNVYWGESITIVTCDFPGLNNSIPKSFKMTIIYLYVQGKVFDNGRRVSPNNLKIIIMEKS